MEEPGFAGVVLDDLRIPQIRRRELEEGWSLGFTNLAEEVAFGEKVVGGFGEDAAVEEAGLMLARWLSDGFVAAVAQ